MRSFEKEKDKEERERYQPGLAPSAAGVSPSAFSPAG
jgi:hypothetical protein